VDYFKISFSNLPGGTDVNLSWDILFVGRDARPKYSAYHSAVLTIEPPQTGIFVSTPLKRGTAVAQWLRCCATNRKVAGSIPAGVTGIFY